MSRPLVRLVRIESVLATRRGCDHCRTWTTSAIEDETGATSRPERCPRCGIEPPIKTRICLSGVTLEII